MRSIEKIQWNIINGTFVSRLKWIGSNGWYTWWFTIALRSVLHIFDQIISIPFCCAKEPNQTRKKNSRKSFKMHTIWLFRSVRCCRSRLLRLYSSRRYWHSKFIPVWNAHFLIQLIVPSDKTVLLLIWFRYRLGWLCFVCNQVLGPFSELATRQIKQIKCQVRY